MSVFENNGTSPHPFNPFGKCSTIDLAAHPVCISACLSTSPILSQNVSTYQDPWFVFVCLFLTAILGVHTLVTSTQSYDGTSSKDGYNSE